MDENQQDISDSSNSISNRTPLAPYPNLSQSWGLFGFFILFSLGIGLLALPFSDPKYHSIKSWVTLFTYTASFVLLLFYIKKIVTFKQQALTLKFGNPPIIVLLLLLIITPLLSIAIEPISELIPMPDAFRKLMEGMVAPNFPAFLTVVIAAPILEEIICRGIILEGLLKNKMNPYHAIMWSALIFAALHMNPWQGIPAFLIGCLIGWVYYKTRSLYTSIFIHFVNNGLAFLLFTLVDNPDMSTKELIGENYIAVYYGAVAVLIILLYVLHIYFKRRDKPNAEDVTLQ